MKQLVLAIIIALSLAGGAWALDIDADNNSAVDIAYGGTNSTTAADARTALGLAIGTDVSAYGHDHDTVYQPAHIHLDTVSAAGDAGNSKYFGTNAVGEVGFHDVASGSGTVEDGDAVGDIPVWDGEKYAPESSLSSVTIGGLTASKMAQSSAEGELESSTFGPSDVALATGDTYTGAHDFGGATLEIPNGNDPNVTTTGQLSLDVNGGWARTTTDDGTTQKALARIQEEIHVTVIKPNDLADAERDKFVFWSNESGMTYVITGWKAWSGTDDTAFGIRMMDADGQNAAEVDDSCTISTDGTSIYTGAESGKSVSVATTKLLYINFDDTDDPGYVKITIYGYYNADVN